MFKQIMKWNELHWIWKDKDKHHAHSVQSNISFIWFCYFNFNFNLDIKNNFKTKTNKQTIDTPNLNKIMENKNWNEKQWIIPFNTRLYSNKSMKWITFGKNHKYIQFKTVIQFKSNVYFFISFILFYFLCNFILFCWYFLKKIKFKTIITNNR